MRKGITLLTVLLLPITIYLIFAISTIHYVPVSHFGPRTTRQIQIRGREKTDTVYHTIGAFEYAGLLGPVKSDALKGHMYIACFIDSADRKNNYDCGALKAYYKVNTKELDTLHFILFCQITKDISSPRPDYGDTLGLLKSKTLCAFPDGNDVNYLKKENFFKPDPQKKELPWKSKNSLVLIDSRGCVRGYYDGRYAPEIARMIEDIKHIKFHDESASMERKYTPVKKDQQEEGFKK